MASRFELPYDEYKALTKRVAQRDKWKCRAPGCVSRTTSAHHIQFRSNGGGDYSHNLVSLCQEHHDMVHGVHPKVILIILHRSGDPNRFPNADDGLKFVTTKKTKHIQRRRTWRSS